MKNLVIQYYIDTKKYSHPSFNNLYASPMEEYSRYSFQRYCKKFDLDYLKITEPKLGFKHPTWERFDLWLDRSWWEKYDQIMYVDSDVIAFDHAPNIFLDYPTIDNRLKTAWYPKFRVATPDGAKLNQRVNPLADLYTGETIRDRFVQPGVMILNKVNTEFMLPWISKYKDITDDRIDDGMFLNLAMNYGGRSEIIKATKGIVKAVSEGIIKIEDLDEQLFAQHLYTHGQEDPDLIIRTAGEKRLSNFLLWQSAYSELYFVEKNWPDFNRADLIEALNHYKARKRKFGSLDASEKTTRKQVS